MAHILIEIPDGELCSGCMFNERGTVWCSLFGQFLSEDENYTDKYKCANCPREDNNDMIRFINEHVE